MTAVRREWVAGLSDKGEEVKKKNKTHRHRQKCGNYQRERRWEQIEKGKGG